ncbi:JAB domain-containing protein [Clostridium cadaveris]|uniref:JAB domain-containing protein n=1 Tax=Clostridium cadaveris TaxID=1529 RepID=UPI00399EF96B
MFQLLDIKIHDHIIVAGVNYYSMAEKGYVPASVNGMAVYESIKMEDKRII